MLSVPIRYFYLSFCIYILFCKKYGNAAFKQEESCSYKRSQMFFQMIGLDNTTWNSSMYSILEFVDDHIDELKFPKHRDVVFVIGTEDSNKALIPFITGAELEARETKPFSGIFEIVDKDGPLNQYSENVVPDLIPQLLTDRERGADYVILPKFNDTTDVKSDLTTWYLIQRSLQFATGVKFLFTLNYIQEKTKQKFSNNDIKKVRHLVRNANLLIKDIEKYSEAISLTVTNVKYNPKQSDIDEIQIVSHLLRKTKDDLKSELDESSPEESNALNKDIRFLSILLEEKSEYTKIKIMRAANDSGLVSNMEFFQFEKYEIMSMVRRNTKYIRNDENDFSFNISNKTKDRVPELVEEMKLRVSDDFSIIEKRIKQIYTETEKEHFDLNVLFDKMTEGYQVISQINADDPRSLVQQIISASEALKIEISSSILHSILKNIELYSFLTNLEGPNNSNLLRISSGMAETTKYLEESKRWYDFLLHLHDLLSAFKVQKNVKEYENATASVMDLCTINENEEKNVTDIDLKNFLEKLDYQLDPTIEAMTVNSFKLKKLKYVLHRTMFDYGTKMCSSNKILVQGYNVKMSDVLEMQCPGDITFREIYALNNIFIDANVKEVGIKLQLIIIAPKWQIIGKRSITLNGKNAEGHIPQKAEIGKNQNKKGKAGKPGKKGHSAGCFMAVGGTFINDENLEVHLTGGKGGPGQEGGNGFAGSDGESPNVPERSYKAKSSWDRKGFEYDILAENEGINLGIHSYLVSKYEVKGSAANPSGDGGDGGAEGLGGLEGNTLFVGIEQTPEFSVFYNIGPNGTGGIGGEGGKGTYNGKTCQVKYKDVTWLFVVSFHSGTVTEEKTGLHHKQGDNGIYNNNDAGIEEPDTAEFDNPLYAINSYKSFVRENLAENIQESTLTKFMLDLEADESIRSQYDTMNFLNELEGLEGNYLRLRNKIPFLPFYESLKDRISEYTDSKKETGDIGKILTFIYTSVIGKIGHLRNTESFRNFKNHVSIIDLLEYLEIVQKNIRKMKDIEKELSVTEQTEAYQQSLKDKMDSGIAMVNNEIIPVISQLFEPLGREIMNLLEEVIKNREKAKKEQEDLEAKIQQEQIFGAFKMCGAIIKIFGPIGTAIGTFIELTTSLVEGITKAAQGLSKLMKGIENQTQPLKDLLKEPFRLYLQQLQYMNENLAVAKLARDEEEVPAYIDVKNTININMIKVNEYLQQNVYVDVKHVYNMRKDLDTKLDAAHEKCKPVCKEVEQIQKVNKLAQIGLDMWNQIKENNAFLEAMYKQYTDIANQFNKWDARMEKIRDVLLPMMFQVEETLLSMMSSLENKTQFELDITAWKVQTTMGDFKMLARQMSDETSLKDDLNRIIEKIEEAFGTMIDIFDRVQSLMDQSKFAGLLSGFQSSNSENIQDEALRKIVTKLKRVLQSNLVLEQYDVAIHSFKEHFFPFAAIHLANFDLPTGLQVEDTEILVRRASEEIDYLQDQVKFLEVSLGRFDREIFGDINFSGSSISIAKPFYIFKSREFKDLFKKLLNGEEIMLKADIARGLSQNAIKFNEIGIQLKLIDEKMQEEFDDLLEDFGVRMSLIGHMYYKCGEQFYYLPVDDNVVIEYSFKKNSNGKPLKYNDVYRKLSEKHYFLSPYTTWKIQLIVINKDFESTSIATDSCVGYNKLAKFAKSPFNLELVGRGQYFRSNGMLETEICTDVVKKYYEIDNSLNDVNPRQLKYKYLLK